MIRRTITVDDDLNKAICVLRGQYMRKYLSRPEIDFTTAINQLAKEGLKHMNELQHKDARSNAHDRVVRDA